MLGGVLPAHSTLRTKQFCLRRPSVALPPFRSDDLDDVSAAARHPLSLRTAGAHSTVEFRQAEAVKAY